MASKLEKFVESWFFDVFCKANDCNSQDEFIDRVWKLYKFKNLEDVDVCLNAAIDAGIKAEHFRYKVESWLSWHANDVIYSLWEDGDLPDALAEVYESEM